MSTNNQPTGNGGAKKKHHRQKSAGTSSSRGQVRVRTKQLDEVDEEKIALAYWLLAKEIVEKGPDDETGGSAPTGVRK